MAISRDPSILSGKASSPSNKARPIRKRISQPRCLDLERADIKIYSASRDQSSRLRSQFDDLTSQFHGFPTKTTSSASTVSQPNDPSLISDFASAQKLGPSSRPGNPPHTSSFLKRQAGGNAAGSPNPNKSVRFRDNADDEEEDAEETANRAALFPYRDNPPSSSSSTEDPQSELSNQQMHAQHSQVLRDQDEQLDRLGASIGRQRDLSIQIGDELDEQVQMLDEVDGHMDRTQGRLDGARRRLENVARKARDNKAVTVMVVLIIVLVFLVVILKT